MAVKIQIMSHSTSENSPEFFAAQELKEILENQFAGFPMAKGNVYIGYSLTLSGQKVRDIDLLLYGEIENCVLKSFYAPASTEQKKDLSIESFCFVIELKDHSIQKVKTENTHLYVNYKGTWKDVSDQSEAQKYSFMNYFYRAKGYMPFVCNLLWFRQISPVDMKKLKVAGNEMNVLPSEFTLQDLAAQNLAQLNMGKYRPYGGMYHINVNGEGPFCNDMLEILKERRIVGGLTRKKLESLTQKNIDSAVFEQSSGKLTIFSGRAGVGKTFYLLQTALRLASGPEGYRCLLLTYNQALVSDIRRLLHYIDIPDKVDSFTVQVQPLHNFFIQLH